MNFFSGNGHGSHDEKSFVFQKPIALKEGDNHLTMLGVLTGFPVRKHIFSYKKLCNNKNIQVY